MILTVMELLQQRQQWMQRWSAPKIVATNGCFDILHAGHVRYLEEARALGDRLVVGLNSDRSVAELKGPGRPVNEQHNRAMVLSALRCVDDVCIFDGLRCADFLTAAFPDIYVKGGDYTEETMDKEERAALECAKIVFVPLIPGCSTTGIIRKLVGQVAESL